MIFIENQWKIMDLRDFPHILGKSGKYEIHPPKLCASLFFFTRAARVAFPPAGRCSEGEQSSIRAQALGGLGVRALAAAVCSVRNHLRRHGERVSTRIGSSHWYSQHEHGYSQNWCSEKVTTAAAVPTN